MSCVKMVSGEHVGCLHLVRGHQLLQMSSSRAFGVTQQDLASNMAEEIPDCLCRLLLIGLETRKLLKAIEELLCSLAHMPSALESEWDQMIIR